MEYSYEGAFMKSKESTQKQMEKRGLVIDKLHDRLLATKRAGLKVPKSLIEKIEQAEAMEELDAIDTWVNAQESILSDYSPSNEDDFINALVVWEKLFIYENARRMLRVESNQEFQNDYQNFRKIIDSKKSFKERFEEINKQHKNWRIDSICHKMI